MSRENVERTRRVIEAFNRRDLQGYLELMDPELEFIPYEVHLEGGDPYLGHAGIRRWWEDLFSVVPDVRAEVFEVRDFGNRTLVGAFTARAREAVRRLIGPCGPKSKRSKPWGCRSKTLMPTPEPARYCAVDVASRY
jgi:hypothetical protein